MKKYQIEVWFERDMIYENEADTKDEVLDILNCFRFSNQYLYFTVKDENNRVVPHYYYNEWSDSIEY